MLTVIAVILAVMNVLALALMGIDKLEPGASRRRHCSWSRRSSAAWAVRLE